MVSIGLCMNFCGKVKYLKYIFITTKTDFLLSKLNTTLILILNLKISHKQNETK